MWIWLIYNTRHQLLAALCIKASTLHKLSLVFYYWITLYINSTPCLQHYQTTDLPTHHSHLHDQDLH